MVVLYVGDRSLLADTVLYTSVSYSNLEICLSRTAHPRVIFVILSTRFWGTKWMISA